MLSCIVLQLTTWRSNQSGPDQVLKAVGEQATTLQTLPPQCLTISQGCMGHSRSGALLSGRHEDMASQQRILAIGMYSFAVDEHTSVLGAARLGSCMRSAGSRLGRFRHVNIRGSVGCTR